MLNLYFTRSADPHRLLHMPFLMMDGSPWDYSARNTDDLIYFGFKYYPSPIDGRRVNKVLALVDHSRNFDQDKVKNLLFH